MSLYYIFLFLWKQVTQVASLTVLYVLLLSSTVLIQGHYHKEIWPTRVAGGNFFLPVLQEQKAMFL